jgi:hypothetical protein
VRDYDSLEFAVEKGLANNWFLRASYLWSRLHGNYSGLTQSDENGRTSPNVGRLFDYPLMMFKDGGEASYGPLPTDRPHQFKTQFIYQLPFGSSIGLNQFVSSGIPVTRELNIFPPNNYTIQYMGRESDGRTPMFSRTDLLVQHTFKLQGTRTFQLSFNVLNLFNQSAVTNRFMQYMIDGGISPNEAAFYSGTQSLESLLTSQAGQFTRDPRFLMDNGFQQPFEARVGLKFLF